MHLNKQIFSTKVFAPRLCGWLVCIWHFRHKTLKYIALTIAKIDFQYGGCHNFLTNQHVTVLEPKFESAHQISPKLDDSRPRYIAIKPFSKWRPSTVLSFQSLVFWSRDLCLNVNLLLHKKNCIKRTINLEDIAKRRFSKSWLSTILNLP